MRDTIQIRSLHENDIGFLREALYYAIFVPVGASAPPKTIIQRPELARYIENFGQQTGDYGFIAVDDSLAVGAVWVRFINGYGFVDKMIPELSIAVIPSYRAKGIGSRLLKALYTQLAGKVKQVSLSVNVGNPAYRLYERHGFEVVATDGDSVTMIRDL